MNNKMQTYNNTEILTSQRTKLVLMMYDGAIRFAEEGIRRIRSNDVEGRGIYLGKAQKIVMELLNVLDNENGGDIAKNLSKLYIFVNRSLTMANVQGKEKSVEDSIVVLKELREGWRVIASTPINPTVNGNLTSGGKSSSRSSEIAIRV